ncbi:hypothetical protein B9T23_13755 [Acinetobacter terrae]|uniref:hypothetical protein n=1 Tax=Acinetobacter terrae TaxID=2731247 RepID=UPI000A34105B|nr:hypothetical protein [Acinetobacter terrae]OTG73411.1 hypothetical protein B9T23_13755 [Acinetobacter terrae]
MAEEWVNFWGVIAAAFIGALALLATATMVQGNFKADKLAEAKRDVFLGLVDHWMDYLMVVNTFRTNPQEEYREAIFHATKNLVSSLHKSSFISKPKTKKEVVLFTLNFTKKNIELNRIVNDWYGLKEQDQRDLNYKLFQILDGIGYEALDLQNLLRTELGITNHPKIDSFLLGKQKEFAAEIKKILLGAV